MDAIDKACGIDPKLLCIYHAQSAEATRQEHFERIALKEAIKWLSEALKEKE